MHLRIDTDMIFFFDKNHGYVYIRQDYGASTSIENIYHIEKRDLSERKFIGLKWIDPYWMVYNNTDTQLKKYPKPHIIFSIV